MWVLEPKTNQTENRKKKQAAGLPNYVYPQKFAYCAPFIYTTSRTVEQNLKCLISVSLANSTN